VATATDDEDQDAGTEEADGRTVSSDLLRATVTYDDGSTGHRPVAQQRFLDLLTRDDVKLFCVTFAATVAGTIVTAMIAGAAVALDRSKFVGRPNFLAILLLSWPAFWGIVAVVVVVRESRHKHNEDNEDTLRRSHRRLLVLLVALGTAFLLLVLLGYAAGVK
jgi:ABC-type glycerol-3-phosphate transport system permease component